MSKISKYDVVKSIMDGNVHTLKCQLYKYGFKDEGFFNSKDSKERLRLFDEVEVCPRMRKKIGNYDHAVIFVEVDHSKTYEGQEIFFNYEVAKTEVYFGPYNSRTGFILNGYCYSYELDLLIKEFYHSTVLAENDKERGKTRLTKTFWDFVKLGTEYEERSFWRKIFS